MLSYCVDICHIYSLFSIKFPICVSSDSVSLLSCGGSMVPERGTEKTVTLTDIYLIGLIWTVETSY